MRSPPNAKPLMISDRTVLALQPAASVSPLTAPLPALVPVISMSGVPAKPGYDEPSMTAGEVTSGSDDRGRMVCTPAPGMLKLIVSGPALPLALASRNDPGPESFVLRK